LGLAYARQGKYEQAVKNYKQALSIDPNYLDAHVNLASALTRVGDLAQAIKHYNEALRLSPDYIDVINNLAWILATAEDAKIRNPAEAVNLAEHACELTKYEQPSLLDTLAAAYAAGGRFSQAIETAEKAIDLAKKVSRDELAEEIQNRLQLYKSGQPYRD
jgi:Tfp pilus assembly protein PilF